MAVNDNQPPGGAQRASGHGQLDAESVISVEEVNRQAKRLGAGVPVERIAALANEAPFLTIESLRAGYGKMEILHDFHLQVARGQSV